jgi:hypothetical protein
MSIPLIHQTDLFRPHGDPDDHFDLACIYALARGGHADLRGILCDYPPPRRKGDPDLAAVAMLNAMTGLVTPMVVGMPQRPQGAGDDLTDAPACDLNGVNWLLRTLRESPEPVTITIVGSAKEVAVASRRDRDLFARKCRAVYLNSGSGTPEPRLQEKPEFNVALDPASFAQLFELPCPLYWFPCYDHLPVGQPDPRHVMKHGTFYQFRMDALLTKLSPALQRYLLSVLDQEEPTHWCKLLRQPPDPDRLAHWCGHHRNMWSTASIFHLAGLGVSKDGMLVPMDSDPGVQVYRIYPVRTSVDAQGRVAWKEVDRLDGPARYKFEVTDIENYAPAMTAALTSWISPLGHDFAWSAPA